MKRIKKHKVKKERGETSAYDKVLQEHDLAYYIHDRVELMHQVFSVLKAKDLRAMAPESVRRLSIDDLQELCTEELLGISSKRLCAIMDGADPPSDTESSSHSHSPAAVETISLDSISSDEEILSHSSRRKKKHRRGSKSKRAKKSKPSEAQPAEPVEVDQSRASRAGLTVLELLELQARARAIRAQLQQEQAKKAAEASEPVKVDDDDDEVEIKEEQPEVVVLSSDDEKPNLSTLDQAITTITINQPEPTVNGKDKQRSPEKNKVPAKKKDKAKKKKKDKQKEITESTNEITETSVYFNKNSEDVTRGAGTSYNENKEQVKPNDTPTITKRANDLVITVPQQITKKIKLNRSKMTVSVNTNDSTVDRSMTGDLSRTVEQTRINSVITKPPERLSSVVSKPKVVETTSTTKTPSVKSVVDEAKDVGKTKAKVKKIKRKQRKSVDKEEDHDEIMLQLSDTEKMDLLEDFDRKHYDNVSSSESVSSELVSSSDDIDSNDESDGVENRMEKDASTVFANKADMLKDGTIAIEVINDNFYRGIEDLDQEAEKNYTNKEKSQESETAQDNNYVDGKDSEVNEKSQKREANNTETEDESSDSESGSSENDSEHETSKNAIENSEKKDTSTKASEKTTGEDTTSDKTINEIQDSVAINTTIEESQQIMNESTLEIHKTGGSAEKLGFVSIDNKDSTKNIEICDIDDIPVVDDEIKEHEVLNENETRKQEITYEGPVQVIEKEPMEVTDAVNAEVVDKNAELADVQHNEATEIAKDTEIIVEAEKCDEASKIADIDTVGDEMENVSDQQQDTDHGKEKGEVKDQELSEGEVSSNESSEVEAFELKPEVVCISDEEEQTSVKKKKKKDKKPKKEKKSKKKKSDFRESGDQNFFTETIINVESVKTIEIDYIGDTKETSNKESDTISLDSNDDIYEILELSDDSSCYEVEGTVLSKEPTAEEIAALSAKIDEIDSSCYIVEDVLCKEPTTEEIAALEDKTNEIDEKDEVVTEEQIAEHERMLKLAKKKRDGITKEKEGVIQETLDKLDVSKENVVTKEVESENIENISWIDRYLDSTKVKKVLKSSNILNALRKKNKELKKKMEESKKKEAEELALKLQEAKKNQEELENKQKLLEEGSIEHYNTLQGSTKYVDPVPDPTEKPTDAAQQNAEDTQNNSDGTAEEARVRSIEIEVTGEMKKDAKQLLKIYKKLLKYNDITKQKDPNKVKKKKKKAKKKDGGTVVCAGTV